MSFGTSASDVAIITSFCKSLYRKCRDAGGDYEEISHEVRALHTVLKHLENTSPDRDVRHILTDCNSTLRKLDDLIAKRGGSREMQMDALGACRVKLISQRTALNKFVDGDEEEGDLDGILDKVDAIAARIGNMRMGAEDDQWKIFRKELAQDGVRSEDLQEHKDVLISYIHEIYERGHPDEDSHDRSEPEHREESTSPRDAHFHQMTGSKELAPREENMKFPTTMKSQRGKPESRPFEFQQKVPSPTARITNQPNELPLVINTSTSNSNNLVAPHDFMESDTSKALVIRTSDLTAPSSAVTLRAPPASPSLSYRSQNSFCSEISPIAKRNLVEYGSSPVGLTPVSTSSRYPVAGQEFHLAPDSKGNPIPADAKWTRVTRRLISLEVLEGEGLRYEARPEFVAILGVLTKSQIEDLAEKTERCRFKRGLRRFSNSRGESSREAPEKPPRPILNQTQPQPRENPSQSQSHYIPIPVPIPIPISNQTKSTKDSKSRPVYPSTSSSSSYSDSESYSEADDDHAHYRRNANAKQASKNIGSRYPKRPSSPSQGSDIGPVSYYPNPFGQPVPPPSPALTFVGSPKEREGMPRSVPNPGVRFSRSPSFHDEKNRIGGEEGREERKERVVERDRERDREREPDRSYYTFAQPSQSQSHTQSQHFRARDPREIKYREERREDPMNNNRSEQRKYRDDQEPRKHHHHHSSSHSNRDRNRDRDSHSQRRRDRERGDSKDGRKSGGGGSSSSSRWKENLTAAGIGGAAVSLLNVLSEAAEGL